MTQKELELLACRVATAHNIPPSLLCAICEQESDWDPWAIRYEPGFYNRYIAPQVAHGQITSLTEAYARAMSWGLMQVMGQVAREAGFVGHFLSLLCDPQTGLDVGAKVLAGKIAATLGNIRQALLLWNGGADTSYPDEVLARVFRYEQPS